MYSENKSVLFFFVNLYSDSFQGIDLEKNLIGTLAMNFRDSQIQIRLS